MMQRPKQNVLTSQQWLFIIVGTAAVFLLLVTLRPEIVPGWVGFALICLVGVVALLYTSRAALEEPSVAVVPLQPDNKVSATMPMAPEASVQLR
ncbi:MAG: hypothetical protein ABI970_02040, partial [Chloroflexota bacterium]